MNLLHKFGAMVTLLGVVCTPSQFAFAHLMQAQHGTLNFVEDGVFMVLSLPLSAFEGLDDDSDGQISMLEFNRHRATLTASIKNKVVLKDKLANCALGKIMLSPELPHDVSNTSTNPAETVITQVTVMGRFKLNDSDRALRFEVALYGDTLPEQSLEITATRASDRQKTTFVLSPDAYSHELFPGAETRW